MKIIREILSYFRPKKIQIINDSEIVEAYSLIQTLINILIISKMNFNNQNNYFNYLNYEKLFKLPIDIDKYSENDLENFFFPNVNNYELILLRFKLYYSLYLVINSIINNWYLILDPDIYINQLLSSKNNIKKIIRPKHKMFFYSKNIIFIKCYNLNDPSKIYLLNLFRVSNPLVLRTSTWLINIPFKHLDSPKEIDNIYPVNFSNGLIITKLKDKKRYQHFAIFDLLSSNSHGNLNSKEFQKLLYFYTSEAYKLINIYLELNNKNTSVQIKLNDPLIISSSNINTNSIYIYISLLDKYFNYSLNHSIERSSINFYELYMQTHDPESNYNDFCNNFLVTYRAQTYEYTAGKYGEPLINNMTKNPRKFKQLNFPTYISSSLYLQDSFLQNKSAIIFKFYLPYISNQWVYINHPQTSQYYNQEYEVFINRNSNFLIVDIEYYKFNNKVYKCYCLLYIGINKILNPNYGETEYKYYNSRYDINIFKDIPNNRSQFTNTNTEINYWNNIINQKYKINEYGFIGKLKTEDSILGKMMKYLKYKYKYLKLKNNK